MARGLPVRPRGARRSIFALGFLYLLLAVVQAVRELVTGNELLDAASAILLTGVPATLILFGAYRLEGSEIDPEIYPRVLAWALAGFGFMLAVVGLRVASPGVSIDQPLRSAVYATSIGTVAGLGIGMFEGQATSRAHLAEKRTEELAETKAELEEKVQRLRELNKRLEQFAYATSHDLKEPLRMITTYLQLLERRMEDDLDDEAEEYIDYAVGGAKRMKNMIDSLLAYSNVTTGGEPLAPTDVNVVLADARDALQLRIEETDAEIQTEPLPTVMADPGQLRAVFRNLLSNALTYSGDPPPRIHIRAEPQDGMWRFAVEDEGPGIDPAYHDKIFEAFERLSGDTDSDEPGAGGIGLALCRRIIERHGGEIWVESEPGRGSTFYFTVPRRDQGAEVLDEPHRRGGGVRA